MKNSNAAFYASGVSVSLVLMLLGAAMYGFVALRQLKDVMLQGVGVSLILSDGATDSQRAALEGVLDAQIQNGVVRSWKYLSKDSAAIEFYGAMGVDYRDVLQGNPIPASYEVKLKSDSVSVEAVERLKGVVVAGFGSGADSSSSGSVAFGKGVVCDVVYGEKMVEQVADVIGGLNWFVLVLGGVLMFVAVILIYNTIALSVASRAAAIQTMKLVGATLSFIRRPFLQRAVVQGAVAGVVAAVLLWVGGVIVGEILPIMAGFELPFAVIFGVSSVLVLLGIIICLTFTAIAVDRQVKFS